MNTIDNIKNRLIDKIMVTNNQQLLQAIDALFKSAQEEEVMRLDSEQIEMLMMSDEDIKHGRLVSQADLSDSDSKWMD